MKRRRIAIDCDDVLMPSAQMLMDMYNFRYGTDLTIKDYYLNDPTRMNAPDEQTAVKRMDEIVLTNDFQNAEPFKDAIESVQILALHHELHLVTGRPEITREATADMLAKYFPELFQSMEFTNFFGGGTRTKAQVCEQLGADLLIDDHMHHAEVVAACGIDVLLFGTYLWNKGEIRYANIQRVDSWSEILTLLVHPE